MTTRKSNLPKHFKVNQEGHTGRNVKAGFDFVNTFEMMDQKRETPEGAYILPAECTLQEAEDVVKELGMIAEKMPNEEALVNGIPLSEIMTDGYISETLVNFRAIDPQISRVSVNRLKTNSCSTYSHPLRENGMVSLSKKLDDWKAKLDHDHIRANEACIARGAESGSHIAKGNVAPSEWRSKPKGKMRQSEYRKAAQQLELYLANVA